MQKWQGIALWLFFFSGPLGFFLLLPLGIAHVWIWTWLCLIIGGLILFLVYIARADGNGFEILIYAAIFMIFGGIAAVVIKVFELAGGWFVTLLLIAGAVYYLYQQEQSTAKIIDENKP